MTERTPTTEYDPIVLEVIRNAVKSTAEEMGTVLTRTSYSTNIKDRKDFSCAVYSPSGQLVAQAEHIPLHLGLMTDSVKVAIEKFDDLAPGDSIMHNDPYVSGSHLSDVMVFTPVFKDGERIAIVGNLAHHVDVGGVPPSKRDVVTQIFEEGIRFPPVKVQQNGEVNRQLLDVFLNNLRTREVSNGDFSAQLGSTLKGESNILELAEKHGVSRFTDYLMHILDYSETRMRSSITEMDDGSGHFTDYIETNVSIYETDEVPIEVDVRVDGDEIHVDFAGTSDQVNGPINAARPLTLSCVYYVVKAVVSPEAPTNDGAYRPIRVYTPDNSLVDAEFPAPTQMANSLTCQRIADALLGAFKDIVPHRVTAASSGSMNSFVVTGEKQDSSEMYSYVETYGGGQGAKHDADGMDGVHTNMTNTRNAPAEVLENTYPFEVLRYGLVADSEGAGCNRGGFGMSRALRFKKDASVAINTGRLERRPWSVFGGESASGSTVQLEYPDGSSERADTTFINREIDAGTTVTFETAGGGGWGSPLERPPEAVLRDVTDGLLSTERAEEVYSVAITDEKINKRRTEFLRNESADK